MNAVTILHDDRLFPSEPTIRAIARRLYGAVRNLPIVSPHGHTEARWFAENEPFPNPTSLFIVPDHYVFRMLYSQGIAMEDLGIGQKNMDEGEARRIWIRFAESYYLFRGTPTRMWLDYAFQELFGLEERLCAANAGALLRHHQRQASLPSLPSTSALRPVQHRSAGHHQPSARPADLPSGDPRFRMEGAHPADLSSRFRRRSRIRWFPRECPTPGRDARRG